MTAPPAKETTKTPAKRVLTWRHWAWLAVTVLLALVPFAYGKYMEFMRQGPFDGAMNLYAAQALLNGAEYGEEIQPSARPATLLVNFVGAAVFGYSEFGPKFIQMIMQAAALVLMYLASRRLFGPLAALVAVCLASLFLSYPLFAKYGNVKEQYMVACMVISASLLILVHTGWPRWVLLISGAAAINVVFFKPTGASVWVAMAVYLLAQLIMRQRSLKDFGLDLGFLLAGAAAGLLPLIIAYAGFGALDSLWRAVPGWDKVVSAIGIAGNGGGDGAEPSSYVAGSKSVSTFASQYDWALRYYRHLIALMGPALVALVWGVAGYARRLAGKFKGAANTQESATAPTPSEPERFAVLLIVWWALDMLFVWVSPRNYVEYFLPMVASSAFLAGYLVWKLRRQPLMMVYLLGAWLAIDVWLHCVGPHGWRAAASETFWRSFAWRLVAVVLAAGLTFVPRKIKGLAIIQKPGLIVLAAVLLVSWFWAPVADFQKRVGELQTQRKQAREQARQLALRPAPAGIQGAWMEAQKQVLAQGGMAQWEVVGQFVQNQSQADDGLFVWGWFPGIYVKAQRFSPVSRPSWSDMHSLGPGAVDGTIRTTVEQLQADPPLFIVDSQKMHFPFYAHPVFDLWPRVAAFDQQSGRIRFDLRMTAGQGAQKFQPLPLEMLAQFQPQLDQQVQAMTYQLLTHPKRVGGPLAEDDARARAEDELKRHQAMRPLREFVMQNYEPVIQSQMFVFRRK